MAEFRNGEDINEELGVLESWSESGAPRLKDVDRSLDSLLQSVDPGLKNDLKPKRLDDPDFEEPPVYTSLRSRRAERRPRQPELLLMLALLLLIAAMAAYLLTRRDLLTPRDRPSTAPGALEEPSPLPTELESPPAAPSPEATPTDVASPHHAPSPEATPAEVASPHHAPSPEATPAEVESPHHAPTPAAPASPQAHGESHRQGAASAAPSAEAAGSYVVRSGDTLSGIARRRLGDASRWTEIYTLNRDVLSNPDAIQPGARLRMPTAEAHVQAAAIAPSRYKVKRGDTLWSIAADQLGGGERWRELYEANRDRLPSPHLLRPGQSLRLPEAGQSGAAHVRAGSPSDARAGHAAAPSRAAFSHQVRPGESLSMLARRYLGSAQRWPEIYALNSDTIANPHWIFPGQRLAIPQAGRAVRARYVTRTGATLLSVVAQLPVDSLDWRTSGGLFQA